MAKNRSRRLRKKMHIEEFQEGVSPLPGVSRKAPALSRSIRTLMRSSTR
ncbi:hypothetical protein ACVXG7_06585 [Enterobacter hormaechei]